MTKREYFEQLMNCLPAISHEDREQIYSYYDELICDGIEEGRTEEEMLKQFGSPSELAARMQEEWNLSAMPVSLERIVEAEKGKQTEQNTQTQYSDFYFNQKKEARQKRWSGMAGYTAQRAFRCIDLSVRDQEIEIVPSYDHQMHIYYPKRLESKMVITEGEDTLIFVQKPEWMLFFPFGVLREKIRIELPKDAIEELKISNKNGKIVFSDYQIKDAELQTSNGKIEMRNVKGNQLTLVSSNGKIEVKNVQGKILSFTTSNGPIWMEKVEFEEVSGRTSNAPLDLHNLKGKYLEVRTSNGKIHFERVEAKEIRLTTSNSAIRGTLPGEENEYSIDVKTSNGRCTPSSIRQPQAEKKVYAYTSNASINIDFEGR